jgi:hypothetical protein
MIPGTVHSETTAARAGAVVGGSHLCLPSPLSSTDNTRELRDTPGMGKLIRVSVAMTVVDL